MSKDLIISNEFFFSVLTSRSLVYGELNANAREIQSGFQHKPGAIPIIRFYFDFWVDKELARLSRRTILTHRLPVMILDHRHKFSMN